MIKNQLFRLMGFACLMTGIATQAQQGCYAVAITEVVQGTRSNGQPITDPIRIEPTKMLGQPQNNRASGADNFFSLGKDGYVILEMGGNIVLDGTSAPDLRVYETTWGNQSCNNYPEYAEVSVSHNGVNWYVVETVCQSSNISLDLDAAVPGGVPVSYVKIANVSALGTTNDFFDVDGVEALFGCTEVVDLPPGECFASCFAAGGYVEGTTKNGGTIPAERTNINNVIGQPQYTDTVNFLTLGYGGSVTLCFDGPVYNGDGDDIFVVETSFYNVTCETYKEYADIEVSMDGNTWYSIGTGCLDFGVDISNASVYLPYVYYVRVKNNDTLTLTPDGYDVDSVVALHGSSCSSALAAYLSTSEATQRIAADLIASPNPSKGDMNFSFNVALDGDVTLEIYNVNGQKVATIFDGAASSSQLNQVSYNASALPNGMYITKLTTEHGVMTGKVMLAR